MNPIAAKQVALNNSLVTYEKSLKIEKCNARIEFSKPQREETYQVTLDALKLSPCYLAFLIAAEVSEVYMHQFWNTIQKIKDTNAYWFKLDKKKFCVDTEVFREILQICPRLLNQDFIEPPSKEELVTFIQELGYSVKCISGKTTGLDRLRELRAQILWGMYNKENVDHVALLWEDFMYQADNREINLARKEHMPYPRFTKVIISHFISKDKTISMRNMINLHTIHDDTLLGTLKFVSKTQDCQQYGALIPDDMINQDVKDFKAYKTYYWKSYSQESKEKSTTMPTTGVAIRNTPSESVPKKKTPAKVDRGKGIDLLSDVTLRKAAQLKKTLKKSKLETHKLHASGSDKGVGSLPKVPDEQEDKITGDSGDDDDDSDEVTKDDDDDDDVNIDADGDNEASDNAKTDEEEENEEENVRTPNSFEFNNDDEEYEELYKVVNVRSTDTEHEKQGKDEEMTNASFLALPDFSSMFGFDQRISALEKELSQLKQVDYSVQLFKMIKSQILAMVDAQLSTRLEDSIKKSFRSYTAEFEKKAKDERKRYIDLVEKSVKEIIKDEVKSQLPQILPKEISDFATPVIQSTINESIENVVLAKSSSQPQSTYEAAA
ncbi:hypothetical protein Tco_0955840, partial [Tanacetum coccineum]